MIFPEIKTRLSYGLPPCNKEGGNPPCTKLRISRNHAIKESMNRQLLQNIDNGIYGLAKTLFSRQQMDTLKNSGYIPEDAELPEDADLPEEEIVEDLENIEETEELGETKNYGKAHKQQERFRVRGNCPLKELEDMVT